MNELQDKNTTTQNTAPQNIAHTEGSDLTSKGSTCLKASLGHTTAAAIFIGARIYTRFEMVLVALVLATVASMILAIPAFAQDEGGISGCGSVTGGEGIISTLRNAFEWIAYVVVILAAIGFILSVVVLATARSNANQHQAAYMGMAGAALAAAAGILTPDVLDLIKSWTGC